MNNQEASIILSRQTLERLQKDYWTLNIDEATQIDEALKAMRINDEIQIVNEVFSPAGTVSHPIKN